MKLLFFHRCFNYEKCFYLFMNWWECKFNRGYIKIKKVCKRMNIKIRKALAPSVQYRQEEFILFSKNANISITKWAKVPKEEKGKQINRGNARSVITK